MTTGEPNATMRMDCRRIQGNEVENGITKEVLAMKWNTPAVNEVKMDAEIGSYQPDDAEREPPIVATKLDMRQRAGDEDAS